jgi:hypothetical protein
VTRGDQGGVLDGYYAISVTGLPPQTLAMALNGRGGRGRAREGLAEQEAQVPEVPRRARKPTISGSRVFH